MKNTVMAFAMATVFAACHSNAKNDETAAQGDSSLMDQSRVINMNGLSDTLQTANGQYVKVKEKPVTVTEVPAPAPKVTRHHTTPAPSSVPVYSDPAPATTPVATAPVEQKKKGWSSAAKGAVIGAGAGAVTGAIVSKKKGTGAIIGGVLGAGGGYAVGKIIDSKKKKKQQ